MDLSTNEYCIGKALHSRAPTGLEYPNGYCTISERKRSFNFYTSGRNRYSKVLLYILS